jgi:uncharacterized protein (DUF488 family)
LLLRNACIDCLVDVRSSPYSRYKPEFNRESLDALLSQAGIRYVFMGDSLGGRPDAPECYVDGKVDYDRLRKRESYQRGIEKLAAARDKGMRVALFCSEGRPEECHRSKLIGTTLVDREIPVLHIDETGVEQSQDQIILRLTGGQIGLFGEPTHTSRKRYSTRG